MWPQDARWPPAARSLPSRDRSERVENFLVGEQPPCAVDVELVLVCLSVGIAHHPVEPPLRDPLVIFSRALKDLVVVLRAHVVDSLAVRHDGMCLVELVPVVGDRRVRKEPYSHQEPDNHDP